MKNFLLIVLFFGFGIYALYEQSKPNPNPFFMFGSLLIFIVGLYQLMKKIPSKNENDEE